MIRHSMDVVKKAVDKLNVGQPAVIAFDQPLYTIAKQIQWNWPQSYGEDKLLCMFGGLHIEKAALDMLGDILQGSGWTELLVQANIALSGTAESFLKAAHITKTRHAHQVTSCGLYMLLEEAYQQYGLTIQDGEQQLSLEEWCNKRSADCPQFKFWHLVLNLELCIFIFIRSVRQGNFQLYVDSLTNLIPWFFVLDHTNYARWLPVHIRDMLNLPSMLPDVATAFDDGNFVVYKTRRSLSAVAIDQAHEQNNKVVKDDGGAVGLTENASALLRWMVAGPEVSTVIQSFEGSLNSQIEQLHHHEQNRSIQVTFVKQVKAFASVTKEMGNPFTELSSDLYAIDTKDVADDKVVESLYQLENIGNQMYNEYVQDRLIERTTSIFAPIKRNRLPLFSKPPIKPQTVKSQVNSLKSDCSLFSRLYIGCQSRNGNIDDFF